MHQFSFYEQNARIILFTSICRVCSNNQCVKLDQYQPKNVNVYRLSGDLIFQMHDSVVLCCVSVLCDPKKTAAILCLTSRLKVYCICTEVLTIKFITDYLTGQLRAYIAIKTKGKQTSRYEAGHCGDAHKSSTRFDYQEKDKCNSALLSALF